MPEKNNSGKEEELTKNTDHLESSDSAPKFPEVEISDEIPLRLVEFFKARVTELIQHGYSPQAAKERAMNLITRSDFTNEIHNLTGHDELNKRQEVLSSQVHARQEAQKRYIMDSLETGKLEPHAHYLDPDPWTKVEKDPAYKNSQKDIEILTNKENIRIILERLVNRKTECVHLADLGPGTGTKIIEIVDRIIKNYYVDLELIDVSPEMLFKTIAALFDRIAWHIRERLTRGTVGENNPWKNFFKFAQKHELTLTQRPTDAALKIEKIFYKWLEGELYRHDEKSKAESLSRFILARKFSMHRPNDVDLFDELDNQVALPLEVRPTNTTFEELRGQDYDKTHHCSSLFTLIGNTISNSHPEEGIRDLLAKNILNEPELIRDTENATEQDIDANYALVSFQVGKFDKPNVPKKDLEKEAKSVLAGYTTDAAINFCSHLFTDPELTTFLKPTKGKAKEKIRENGLIDPDEEKEQTKELKREDCFDIVTSYEEDPENPGYYLKVHRLVFKKDVKIQIAKKNHSLNASEYYYYEKKKGEEIILLPSYNPTISQMHQLCKNHGLQIVETFTDDEDAPTTAVLLIRKMTKKERENSGLFQIINLDPEE
jgi:hypothetical protein